MRSRELVSTSLRRSRRMDTRLVLADERACLGNASSRERSLDLELLMWTKVHDRIERKVSGQSNAHAMLAWSQQHGLADAIELVYVSCKLFVNENRGPVGSR